MEIKTCEQYVLSKVTELEHEVERLKVELLKKESELKEAQDIITTYDELVRVHGELDHFNSGNKIEVGVYDKYDDDEKSYFKFLEERNGKWLQEKDYRDKQSDETTEEATE